MIYHLQCIVGYIVLSVLSKINVGFERWFGGNISAPKHGCVKQALQGVLEFELFKQDPTTTGTCNKFALLHQQYYPVHDTHLPHIDLYFI